MHRIAIPILICILASMHAGAQERWVPIDNGVNGATLMSLVVARDGSVVAGTVDGVYRSTDDRTWKQLPVVGARYANRIIAFGASKLIVLSQSSTDYSSDDGATWNRFPTTMSDGRVVTIALADSSGGIIGTAVPNRGIDYGYVRSTDEGRSWQEFAPSLEWPLFMQRCITSVDGKILFAAQGQLYSTSDLGQSWDSITFATPASAQPFALVDDTTMLAACEIGIHRSSDNGSSWQLVSDNIVAMFTGSGDELYAVESMAIERAPQTLRSTDRGRTWSPIGDVIGDAFLGWAFVLTPRGNLVAARGKRVVRSDDHGATWSDATNGLNGIAYKSVAAGFDNALYALRDEVDGNSIEVSRDDGNTWSSLRNKFDGDAVSLVVTSGSALVVSVYQDWESANIVRSIDDGETWSVVYDSSIGFVRRFARGPGGMLFAACTFPGSFASGPGAVLASFDDGRSWSDAGLPYTVDALTVLPSGSVLAGSFWWRDHGPPFGGGSIWRARANSTSWSRVNDTLELHCMVSDNAGMVFAGGGNRAYRSIDDGDTWSSVVLNSNASMWIATMAIDSNGSVYAGTDGAGVFRSDDHGITWYPFNDGVLTRSIREIVVSPSNIVYMATRDNGLFKLDANSKPNSSVSAFAMNISPNPSSGVISIAMSIPDDGNLDVQVYSLTGELVATVVSAYRRAGELIFSFDSATLADGAYFVVARIGEHVAVRKLTTMH